MGRRELHDLGNRACGAPWATSSWHIVTNQTSHDYAGALGRRRVSSTAISVAISSSPTCPRSMRRDISSASIRPLLLGVDVVVPVEPAQGSLVVRLNLVRGGFPVNACPVNRTEAAKAEKHHICAPVTTRCAEYDMIGFGRAADSTPFNRCRAISGTEMARIHMPLEWIDERQPVRRS